MGRDQQIGIYDVEKSVGSIPGTEIRSLFNSRRLLTVVLFAAFLPVVITSSFFYYTTPDASTAAMLFFHKPKGGKNVPSFISATSSSNTGVEPSNGDTEITTDTNQEESSRNSPEPEATDEDVERTIETSVDVENSTSLGVNDSKPHEETTLEENTSSIVMERQGPTNTANSSKREYCDLVKGSWVPDPRPPQYTNSSCRYIQGHQNCMKNGRPDTGFMYWKWQPQQCDLPRIDAQAFLIAMRNRSMTFAGDSIARNQFQSLLCILSQVEVPDHTYNAPDDRDNIYVFRTYDFTVAIYWSPYLVHVEDKDITWPDNKTQSVAHIHVDKLDRAWTDRISGVDILQISTGQWWFKRGLFLKGNKPMGGHICDGWKECEKEIGFADPYRLAIHSLLKNSLSIPGYTGTTILRSFAPDHFEGGAWDSGGRCVRTTPGGVSISSLTNWMYEIQTEEFQNVTGAMSESEKQRIKLLDITNLAQIRADGHPDVYMKFQPFSKEMKQPPQKDCLHWCLPGPIDTWNDLLVESLHDKIHNY